MAQLRTGCQPQDKPNILLMTGQSLAMPIYIGAAMKIFCDLALWRAFRNLKPREET